MTDKDYLEMTRVKMLKSQTRRWADLTQGERDQIQRTCSVRMWGFADEGYGTNNGNILWGKNSNGEWCRYS